MFDRDETIELCITGKKPAPWNLAWVLRLPEAWLIFLGQKDCGRILKFERSFQFASKLEILKTKENSISGTIKEFLF
jgi:hypothetical protein